MMDSKLKGLAFCSVVALLSAGQAMAHTGVRDAATAGIKSYNAFTITHGCADYVTGGQQYPVIGQAALFPFGSLAVWKETNGTIIDGSTIVSGVFTMGASALAGAASPFPVVEEIVDNLGNVHGMLWKEGAVEPKTTATVPFLVTPPAIIDACISSVKVRVGVINFCDTQANQANDASKAYPAPKDFFNRPLHNTSVAGGIQGSVATSPNFVALPRGNGDHNRADWWFNSPEGGSTNFADQAILGEAGLWSAGITVNNPGVAIDPTIKAACPGGAPRQVTVEAPGADFDAYLTAGNLQPFVKKGQVSNY